MLLFQRRSAQALFPSNADANSHVAAADPSYADSAEYYREPGWSFANAYSDLHRRSGSGSLPDSDCHAAERRTRAQHANTNSPYPHS